MSEKMDPGWDISLDDRTRLNLCIITSPEGLLLGRKTRGYAKGRLVMPGGKEKYQPTNTGIAKRRTVDDIHDELYQETGLALPEGSFRLSGYLYIEPEKEHEDDIDEGETRDVVLARAELPHPAAVRDSDELQELAWYPTDTLPYDDMPGDCRLWLPYVLDRRIVTFFIRNSGAEYAGSELYVSYEDPTRGRLEHITF
jgi:hypothetical protein